MTAPVRRRPLPALALIAVLLVLTAIVWFRVIHRGNSASPATPRCPSPSVSTPAAKPSILPYPKQVAVLLLNSTHRDRLAKKTSTLLAARGFKITAIGDDGAKYGGGGVIPGVGEIRYGKHAAAAATLLSYYFPKATLEPTKSANSIVIVSLGRQFTALPTKAAVSTALTRSGDRLSSRASSPSPSPSPSATGC